MRGKGVEDRKKKRRRRRKKKEVQGNPRLEQKKTKKKKLSQPYPFFLSLSPFRKRRATQQRREEDVDDTVIEPLRLGGKVQSCQTFKVSLGKGGKRRGGRRRRGRRRVGERGPVARVFAVLSASKPLSQLPFPPSHSALFSPHSSGGNKGYVHTHRQRSEPR